MKPYLQLLEEIYFQGTDKGDRTGTGTRSLFGRQIRFDLSEGFPLVTTKKLHLKSIIHELLWFISGNTNIKYLQDNGVRIWDSWADEDGNLGPVYGHQWRSACSTDNGGSYSELPTPWGIDQLANAIDLIKSDPNSRRIIIDSWQVADLEQMALTPCHCLIQFYVADGKLSCQLYQRSADMFLGVPFNIASYALLTHMVAQVCNLKVGEFIHTFGDLHIYSNHFPQVLEQLQRSPRSLPKLRLNPDIKDIDDFRFEDIEIIGYDPHPRIAAEVSV